ncbi:MAG: hypothetical protein AB7O52_19185 [Planctomycetota bacterium]
MEQGILLAPDVVELLRQFDLLEIYTDNQIEREQLHYDKVQRQVTGYNANPTYIVLDSENQREVARASFTNSKEEFLQFLRAGVTNRPVFRSELIVDELTPLDGQLDHTVEWPELPAPKVDSGREATYLGQSVRAYMGTFTGTQALLLPSTGLPPGRYRVQARLLTSLYRDDEWREALSIPARAELTIE